ncbi:MAG: nitrile hydratase subunit beta [Alphaproteobacteria bacterium]|nr:nitrile hydratase subunit beta [Alphaproteobacteria bacterium]MBU0805407.1 nitrile hydratase subunit beta [Alphaproteobacteria bacterium]MBU0873353.1 nitrile hydratase subunit beta [Alphaproteobacteria bacterium]MBU1401419.1 nitrile hydratase subunit beta [Alphaproteobacteria bacterium]MBU1592164.1 nitrile hydratase subunit beta [Alphaproteobacteria bacterium]
MNTPALSAVRPALFERPSFAVGDRVRVSQRAPIGHYRVPIYLRGIAGVVARIIEPAFVDNEEEGYGRNAGSKRYYYRVAFAMTDLWNGYTGSPNDELQIEIIESWLEQI